jgi:hypothetical protein
MQTAYLFGAGASVGATKEGQALPPQQGLLATALRGRTNGSGAAYKLAHDAVRWYLNSMFPGRSDAVGVPYEDVIGPLEWLESEESVSHIGPEPMRNARTLMCFDYLLAYALNKPVLGGARVPVVKSTSPQEKRDQYNSFYRPDSHSHSAYARLLAHLRNAGAEALLLSFNYDLLLDRSVFHESSGFNLRYLVSALDEQLHQYDHEGQSELPLIKPHGSLNWGRCAFCHRLSFMGTNALLPGSQCLVCQATPSGGQVDVPFPYGPFSPLLIRPSFDKTRELSSRIWNEVRMSGGSRLSQCNRWIFIGYAFPQADFWVRAWLRTVVKEGYPQDVLVVDPCPDDSVINRYRDFFGPKVELRRETFWAFVDTL